MNQRMGLKRRTTNLPPIVGLGPSDSGPNGPPLIRLARHAMATRFEIVLAGERPEALRAAGEEALDEIERMERRLSRFRPDSDLFRINVRAAREPVQVDPPMLRFLRDARALTEETGGCFDITAAPLAALWRKAGEEGRLPGETELAVAREACGWRNVALDDSNRTVRFANPLTSLDAGAVGKGLALGEAAWLIREAGVDNALLHGGTSTVVALGRPPDRDAWRVAVAPPAGETPAEPLSVVDLSEQVLSVSAVWGRNYSAGGREWGHVISPLTGQPAGEVRLAAVIVAADKAMAADALSTALLVGGRDLAEEQASRHPIPAVLLLGKESTAPWMSHWPNPRPDGGANIIKNSDQS